MTRPARIPSDVNRPDRVVGPFTARQAAILAATAAALYLLWTVLRGPGRAGGVPRRRRPGRRARRGRSPSASATGCPWTGSCSPRYATASPPAPPTPELAARSNTSPAGPGRGASARWISARTGYRSGSPTTRRRNRRAVGAGAVRVPRPCRHPGCTGGREPGGVGVVDLGPDGLVVIAVVSTVNFALRTPAEQDGLVAGFARYLHALGGPVQILIRALPVDLTPTCTSCTPTPATFRIPRWPPPPTTISSTSPASPSGHGDRPAADPASAARPARTPTRRPHQLAAPRTRAGRRRASAAAPPARRHHPARPPRRHRHRARRHPDHGPAHQHLQPRHPTTTPTRTRSTSRPCPPTAVTARHPRPPSANGETATPTVGRPTPNRR